MLTRRKFLQGVAVAVAAPRELTLIADRFPALVIRTVESGRFLDTDMKLAGTRMWPLYVPGPEHYEPLSERRCQSL
jgi:hypothetical protein